MLPLLNLTLLDLLLALALGLLLVLPIWLKLADQLPGERRLIARVSAFPAADSSLEGWARLQPRAFGADTAREGERIEVRIRSRGVRPPETQPPWEELGYAGARVEQDRRTLLLRHPETAHVASLALVYLSLTAQAGYLAVALWRLRRTRRGRDWLSGLFTHRTRRAVVAGLIAGMLLASVGLVYGMAIGPLATAAGVSAAGPWEALARAPLTLRIPLVLLGIAVPAFVEELFFRGVLYGRFVTHERAAWGLWVSAAAFALGRLDPINLPGYFLMGLGLAWLYGRAGNLLAPCLARLLHALFAFGTLFLSGQP
ncbi:MAG: lysostaphin resistance A-like protein [Armatimonadota bacterium]